jgi:photosystem II stability/assembly factor-like uncharacterized protein
LRSTDHGSTWSHLDNRIGHLVVASLKVDWPVIFAGTDSGLFRSTDNGDTWNASGLQGRFVTAIEAGPDSAGLPALFAGTSSTGEGAFRSSDGGASWLPAGLTSSDVLDFAVAPMSLDSSTICLYATTSTGVFRTCDGGRSWAPLNSYPVTNGCSKIEAVPLSLSQTVLFATGALIDVFKSTNLGETWLSVSNGLLSPYRAISLLAVPTPNLTEPQILFTGTHHGVFKYTLFPLDWSPANTGVENEIVLSLGANQTDLFAGTYSNGIYKRPLSELLASAAQTAPTQPGIIRLWQNYPNPFNGSSIITFELSHTSAVSLVAYDFLGREIATLCSGTFNPGPHSVNWQATGMSSGVYFYRLVSEGTTQTKMLQILR